METLLPFQQLTDATISIERAVLASIADGVIVNDLSGNVSLINQAACRLLRVDPAVVLEKPVRALFASFSTRARLALIDALERVDHDPYSYGPGEGITETVIELEARVIQAHLSPVLTEIGEFSGIVTILRDITREVEAEHAKSDFVSNVSHELRTPLTSIVGYTNLLLGHAVGPLSDPQASFLGVIQTNANRLVTLINELLDISRIESGRLDLDIRPVSLAEVLHEVAEMIRPQCEQKDLHLSIEIEPEVDQVLGDRNRLVQIVTNLASNAYRYTPSGGSITLSLARTDTSARVAVTDTGIGIGLEDQ
ncbi:MAG TPA: histidine kinase dimerization/phospho-acceptor domain-containing protein, partial [Anaerolineae bacterium]|nr:histidine kinase dimerization/phospho-acceptor domain-containing protein [Anaerolineae bacterium]